MSTSTAFSIVVSSKRWPATLRVLWATSAAVSVAVTCGKVSAQTIRRVVLPKAHPTRGDPFADEQCAGSAGWRVATDEVDEAIGTASAAFMDEAIRQLFCRWGRQSVRIFG